METYLFKDILFALREEYLKNEELLEQLRNYVLVLDKKVCGYDFSLSQYSVLKKPELIIEIEKQQSRIEKFVENFIKQFGYDKKNNSLILFSNNGDAFVQDSLNLVISNSSSCNNSKSFYESVKEILNNQFSLNIYSTFMNFEDETDLISRLNTTQEGIELFWYTKSSMTQKKCLYQTKKDILSFSSPFISNSFIKSVLNKEVPKNILPDFHQKIIEQYNKNKPIEINDSGNSKDFCIIEDDKKIVLQRK